MSAALLLALASQAFASGSGVTGFNSLKLLRGARPAGMAGAFTAVADDVNALLYNPAGLNELRDVQIGASHMEWLDGVKDDSIALGFPLYGLGAWGLGATYLYAQDLARDNWGNPSYTFNDFDFSAQAAFSLQVGDHAGIGLLYKILRQGYDTRFNMGSAFDAGLRADFLSRRLTLGLTLQNMGANSALGANFSPLPFTLRGGLAYKPAKDWIFGLDYEHQPYEFVNKARLGVERRFGISDNIDLALRAGWLFGPENEQGGLSGLHAGVGFDWSGLQVDYAYVPQGDLGLSQRISMTYSFGQH
ncbi:MAG: PorV/PorQ family protein [candidate division FCPU426 bacterium]